MEQIHFIYFCIKSSSDHFCQTFLNSDEWFQWRRFFEFIVVVIRHAPWRPCFFLLIKLVLAIFVEGHPVTNSAKLFSILTIGCRGEDVLSFLYRYIRENDHTPWGHVFWRIKLLLAIFVGHPVITSTKLFWIWTTGFRDDFLSFHYRVMPCPLASIFFNGSNSF